MVFKSIVIINADATLLFEKLNKTRPVKSKVFKIKQGERCILCERKKGDDVLTFKSPMTLAKKK